MKGTTNFALLECCCFRLASFRFVWLCYACTVCACDCLWVQLLNEAWMCLLLTLFDCCCLLLIVNDWPCLMSHVFDGSGLLVQARPCTKKQQQVIAITINQQHSFANTLRHAANSKPQTVHAQKLDCVCRCLHVFDMDCRFLRLLLFVFARCALTMLSLLIARAWVCVFCQCVKLAVWLHCCCLWVLFTDCAIKTCTCIRMHTWS